MLFDSSQILLSNEGWRLGAAPCERRDHTLEEVKDKLRFLIDALWCLGRDLKRHQLSPCVSSLLAPHLCVTPSHLAYRSYLG